VWRSPVTDWTTERGDLGPSGRPRLRAVTGETLLMSTEELLAVLEEGPAHAPPPLTPGARAALELAAAPEPPGPPRVVRAMQPPPEPPPRPGLLRRLRCGRRGHDPRPHRFRPHDEVVYRCLRCGLQMAGPKAPQRP
jgi:hypothetical protein